MSNIVNLRMSRKHAAREKAANSAAENRLAHGVSKTQRERNASHRAASRRTLDQCRIEPGER